MNISHLMPFLSLLLLLPATSNAAIVIPHQRPNLKPGDLCPLIHIVEHELCVPMHLNEHDGHHGHHDHHNLDSKTGSQLCVLLQEYNTTFCATDKEKFVTKPISYDVMSVHILEHEFHNASEHTHQAHEIKDIHKVCPIINFIEQELCTSRNEEIKVHFDPKELCPLLNLTYTEICE
jgi:hypothetical protein